MANDLTKTELAMAAVIDLLLAAGFEPAGHTREEVVRIPTSNAPLFGRSGGELARFCGRQRFAKPGTSMRATVGPRTVAIYRAEEGKGLQGVQGIATHRTQDLEQVHATIAGLSL